MEPGQMTPQVDSLAGAATIGILTIGVAATETLLPSGSEGLIGAFMEKGGLVAILAVLIYFYRRDWMRLNESNRDQNTQLIEVIRESNKVHQITAVAIQQNSDALGRLSDAVERQ
jgi:hypothetical protein